MQKKGPIALIAGLILLLIFIVGLRYGQNVEKTNKQINFVLSIPPSKAPTEPTASGYKTYVNVSCALEFLYPDNLVVDDSTSSAIFVENNIDKIKLSCDKSSSLAMVLKDDKVATAEVLFQNRKLQGKSEKNGSMLVFQITNPLNSKVIFIEIDKKLYPLFEKTLEFGVK